MPGVWPITQLLGRRGHVASTSNTGIFGWSGARCADSEAIPCPRAANITNPPASFVSVVVIGYLDFLSAAAFSSARAPARTPTMLELPSWQAYSYISSWFFHIGISTVQGRRNDDGSSTVNL